MAVSKKILFEENEVALADLFKALSHPARVAILKIIASKNSCICGEIVDEVPLAQATVSQHLAELKKVGLIKGEISGPKTCYCLNPEKLNELKTMTGILLDGINCSDQNCC